MLHILFWLKLNHKTFDDIHIGPNIPMNANGAQKCSRETAQSSMQRISDTFTTLTSNRVFSGVTDKPSDSAQSPSKHGFRSGGCTPVTRFYDHAAWGFECKRFITILNHIITVLAMTSAFTSASIVISPQILSELLGAM